MSIFVLCVQHITIHYLIYAQYVLKGLDLQMYHTVSKISTKGHQKFINDLYILLYQNQFLHFLLTYFCFGFQIFSFLIFTFDHSLYTVENRSIDNKLSFLSIRVKFGVFSEVISHLSCSVRFIDLVRCFYLNRWRRFIC